MASKEGNDGVEETEALAADEAARLSRQLRLMENDKRAYVEESSIAIAHQRRTLEVLEEEERKLSLALAAQNKTSIGKREGKKIATVLQLLQEAEDLEAYIKTEELEILKLKSSIEEKSEKKIMKKRESTYGSLEGKDLDERIFLMKRKLETVAGQCDALVAENGELREGMDLLMRENLGITMKWEELEALYEAGKNTIDELVEEAATAFDEREETMNKGRLLIERNLKEKKQFVVELSELTRVLRQEEKLHHFMEEKNKDRVFYETEEQRLSRLEQAKEQVSDESLILFKKCFKKLLIPKSPDILSLADEYEELYTSNIRKFNYINELNKDIENLEAQVRELRVFIGSSSSETVEKNESTKVAILKRGNLLMELKEEVKGVKREVNDAKIIREDVVRTIERLFHICDSSPGLPVLDLLGSDGDISAENALLYLSILETRVKELINAYKVTHDSANLPSHPLLPNQSGGEEEDITDSTSFVFVDKELLPLPYSEMRDKYYDASVRSRSRSASNASPVEFI